MQNSTVLNIEPTIKKAGDLAAMPAQRAIKNTVGDPDLLEGLLEVSSPKKETSLKAPIPGSVLTPIIKPEDKQEEWSLIIPRSPSDVGLGKSATGKFE